MTKRRLIIATRESPLALQQTELIKKSLQELHPNLEIKLLRITTEADKRLDISLQKIGGKGLFVKELEAALLEHKADIAVHSVKDMPMDLPPGLILAVVTEREDPRDVLISNSYHSLTQLPRDASIGTSSLRRKLQIKLLRIDLVLHDLRGNVNTRLKRLEAGEFDAIILAAAGMIRLGLKSYIKSYFSENQLLPAAGQGALGIECRSDDAATLEVIQGLNHLPTFQCITAERALCRHLNGGCQIPLGSYAQIHDDSLAIEGFLAGANGMKVIRSHQSGHPNDAEQIGLQAAHKLLQNGARDILREYI